MYDALTATHFLKMYGRLKMELPAFAADSKKESGVLLQRLLLVAQLRRMLSSTDPIEREVAFSILDAPINQSLSDCVDEVTSELSYLLEKWERLKNETA